MLITILVLFQFLLFFTLFYLFLPFLIDRETLLPYKTRKNFLNKNTIIVKLHFDLAYFNILAYP